MYADIKKRRKNLTIQGKTADAEKTMRMISF